MILSHKLLSNCSTAHTYVHRTIHSTQQNQRNHYTVLATLQPTCTPLYAKSHIEVDDIYTYVSVSQEVLLRIRPLRRVRVCSQTECSTYETPELEAIALHLRRTSWGAKRFGCSRSLHVCSFANWLRQSES